MEEHRAEAKVGAWTGMARGKCSCLDKKAIVRPDGRFSHQLGSCLKENRASNPEQGENRKIFKETATQKALEKSGTSQSHRRRQRPCRERGVEKKNIRCFRCILPRIPNDNKGRKSLGTVARIN